MNHDVPETLAAARSRAADLEQQLKLSDEGVSRLAERCLELEQQVLTYQAALAKHSSENESAALTLPQLFYDSGSGFSPRECLTATEDAYDELTHEVSAVFTLPTDARALRLERPEIKSLMDQCACVVCASRDDPMPTFVTEGLIFGKPSIVSEHTGTAGLVTEGVDGFVYKDDDPDLLAKALEYAILHPEKLAAMKAACRKMYETYYSNEAYVATLTRLVKEMTE